MSSENKKLTKQDIEEITGFKDFDNIEDLEILFNNFSEISNLIGFPKLRRLACIDNGIKRISNLEPVSLTLQILNLSDQDISKVENLNLPQLRELYLHRNYIRSVGSSSLTGCPRLKKLWLCQNQITTIDGLHGVPELEELWLQSNNIVSLEGLACCSALKHLGLAGNHVSDFSEVRRLSGLKSLSFLSFQDIHFGRCPVSDEEGYKEFVMCHLPGVEILDGVEVTAEQVADAHMQYVKEVSIFNELMNSIEDSHVKNLQTISHKQQSRTSHSSVLEKEMVTALSELEGFVAEGRKSISRQMKHQNDILHHNMKDLKHNIDATYKETKKSIEKSVASVKEEYDLTESIFLILEKVYGAVAEVSDTLASAKREDVQSSSGHGNTSGGYIYHPISDNTPDFQHVAAALGGAGVPTDEAYTVRGIQPLGLMKLFKTYLPPSSHDRGGGGTRQQHGGGGSKSPTKSSLKAFMQVGSNSRRAFTVCTLSQLALIVNNNWSQIEETLVFCSSPGVAASLFMANPSSRDVFEAGYAGSGSASGRGGGRASLGSSGRSHSGGSDDEIPLLLGGERRDMPAYAAAQQVTLLVLLCCDIDVVTTGISVYLQEAAAASSNDDAKMIRLPVNASARVDLLRELQGSKKLVGLQLEHGLGWVYTVPPSRREGGRMREREGSAGEGKRGAAVVNADAISLEYICLCTDSLAGVEMVGGGGSGGVKLLEQRLEVLLSPSAGCGLNLEDDQEGKEEYEDDEEASVEGAGGRKGGGSSSAVLRNYEARLKGEVQRYVDQVLEELTSEQADVLRGVDHQVYRKESQLQALKVELAEERKLQEGLLRDMRVYGEQGNGASGNGHDGKQNRNKPRGSKY